MSKVSLLAVPVTIFVIICIWATLHYQQVPFRNTQASPRDSRIIRKVRGLPAKERNRDETDMMNAGLQGGKQKIKGIIKSTGQMSLANPFRSQAFYDCQSNQLYDTQRLVCLDRCGRDNDSICGVEHFCSSNHHLSQRYKTPFCMNRCVQACDETSYCDHHSAECRPCNTLCDGSTMDACRAYCYDAYITLSTTKPQPPWETCSTNQYYDFDRNVCLDRCGADNAEECGVDQFCSTTVTWGMEIHPPTCLNHCPHPCDDATYCDSISHQCLSCQDLCGDTNIDRCRIHCYEVFIIMTSVESQTPASIPPANCTGLSTDIFVYQVIVGVLSAAIVVLVCVLAMKHCRQSPSRNTSGKWSLFSRQKPCL